MSEKITLDDKEYDVARLNEKAKASLALIQFTDFRIKELTNMQALLQRAKNSYSDSIKMEVLARKSGILFGED